MTKKNNVGIILNKPKKCICGKIHGRTKAYKDLAGNYWFDCECKIEVFVPYNGVQFVTNLVEREAA